MAGAPDGARDQTRTPWCAASVPTSAATRKLACIRGTVTVGEEGPIELNPLTARLPRA
jgi:hypothetical protein